jgi:hypothetical protein
VKCRLLSSMPIIAAFIAVSLVAPALRAEEKAEEKKNEGAGKVIGLDGETWTSLFDGKSLGKWEVLDQFDFKRHGKVEATGGCLVLGAGQSGTGVRWTSTFPKTEYELALEAKRVEGGDFFCGLTFPVGDKALTLIMGGWGGSLVGLSCIDGEYAVENETNTSIQFEQDRWYHIRVRVTKTKITVWIDDKETVKFDPEGRKLNVSWEMEPCQPLGIATWLTAGSTRNIQYREIEPPKPR